MVKQLQMKMMLLLFLLIGAGTTAWAATTYKLTQVTSVQDNGLYVFEQNSYVMNNTVSSNALQTTNSYKATGLTGTEAYVWKLEAATGGGYYMRNVGISNTYEYLTNSSSTNVSFSKEENRSVWTFNFQDDGTVLIQNKSNSNRFLGYTSSNSHAYKAYATSNLDSYPHAIKVYKLEEEVILLDNATSVTIDASGITNTNVFTGTAAGSLSATVKDKNGNAINGATVTWSSGTESVATIASDGTVTLVGEGTTVITASYAGVSGTYDPSSATYELTVTNVDPNAPGTQNNPYTVAQAIANTPSSGTSAIVYIKGIVCKFYKTSIVGDGSNYRYYISDDGTESNALLVFKGKGLNNEAFSNADDLQINDEVVICGGLTTYNGTKEVAADNYIVSLKRKSSPALSFDPTTATCDLLADFTEPTLSYANGFDGTVTYSSSNENVATVNATSGEVTLVGVGETTITASSEVTEDFKAGEASYTLTVTKNPDVPAVAPVVTSGKYVKVTSNDGLVDGQYLIVYEDGSVAFDGGLETLDAVSNTIKVTIENSEIEATEATDAAQFILASTDDVWTLKSASDFYIGQTSNANGLASSDTEEYENTISFDANGNANIVSSGAYLRYNSASNQVRFRYFKSSSYTGQKAIQLYKYVPGESSTENTVTLSGYGYKTLVASKNFTVSEGTTAYIVTDASQTSVTTQEISVVPANAPVFLKGTANAEVTLTFTEDEADDVLANKLAVSTSDQGNGCYVLAALDGEVGFYMWAGGSLGAGRVILPASEVPSGARQFLPFNEATGIDEIVSSKPTNGEWYDLQGRRVVKAQKGLYIMNGKKVLVK